MILTCTRDGPNVTSTSSLVAGKRGGSSVGQSRGLIILRSQVQVLPAPPIYLLFVVSAEDATVLAATLDAARDRDGRRQLPSADRPWSRTLEPPRRGISTIPPDRETTKRE